MKPKDFKSGPPQRLTPEDQKALRALLKEQPNALGGVRREQKKGYSDLPLFKKDDQTSLF